MKRYYTKLLPTLDDLGTCNSTKLYLCDKDIEVGDRVRAYRPDMVVYTYCTIVEKVSVGMYRAILCQLDDGRKFSTFEHHVFKIVKEIDDANIEEGQEYEDSHVGNKKFRVGKKQKRVILNERGTEVAHFEAGQEDLAQEVCDFLNSRGKEYILCAAVWYKDIPLKKPEVLEPWGFRPYNVDRGAVFSGWRHGNCIYLKSAVTGLRDAECGEFVQGFLTNKNRFVDRVEGLAIARDANQVIDESNVRLKRLHSEDIY